MSTRPFLVFAVIACTSAIAARVSGVSSATASESDRSLLASEDPTGQVRTINLDGKLDLDNPFFQDLGTNGRRCVTCHQPQNAWTITPGNVQERFDESSGADPIFTNNDGSNCEGAVPRSLDEARSAYSLLLSRGLIRIGRDMPADAEFVIEAVDDPYACGPATNDASFYRRPLPSTNLQFLTAVMWDGRESQPTTTILQDLAHQANDATLGHAQAAHDISPEQAQQIVAFETGLFTAQARDNEAGSLHAAGAGGGPAHLLQQPFFIGINDPVGLNPTGAAFDPSAFTLFNAWETLHGSPTNPVKDMRRAIARGETIFNTRPFVISGVAGLNGQTFASGVTVPDSFSGTCTICHDSPNVGNHSVKAPLNIGLSDPDRAPYLPVYTVRRLGTDERVRVTDLGRAMITGKWQDVGKFKGPILRALAARAPYFHNGSAATLEEVIEFYETRFNLGLTAQEKADLLAFLRAL
jgi:cytochrome c peroxidase